MAGGIVMDAYRNLIEILIKRELGILGKERVESILKELDIKFDFETQRVISYDGNGKEVLQQLGEKILDVGGEIALIGARVTIFLNAGRENLELPPVFS